MTEPDTLAEPPPLGRFGLWTFALDRQPWSRAKEAAAEIEQMGWDAIWVPEATNRNALVNSTLLLGATDQLVVATGIAPIHNRDAVASANGQRTLDEAFPGRFLFGLGVSHQWLVEDVRGGHYTKPLATKLEVLHKKYRKPIIFTEAGYAAAPNSHRTPWEDRSERPVHLEAQAKAYDALLSAFYLKPWFAGVFWWKLGTNGFGGPQDNTMTPWNKPAMNIIKRWYQTRRATTPTNPRPSK